ncbi:uncharacterized protein A4U43_C05F13060 [Asparagus officinalis]|uniref:Uncharacterized protein n=1 Tax=Asparagus officinalis TaxID=4686 RepID=A0A5P1ESA7_ASPOF|nr:uncharacterized protein A4U43_C05F13060 [Asparagus officinalis]
MTTTYEQVSHSKATIDHHNHYGHGGTCDLEVTHAFDGNFPLFLEDSSQKIIEVIRSGDYRTLQEIITNAKFSIPDEGDNVKVGSLKYDSGFRQEGLYGDSVTGLCLGFVNEDAPINEIVIVPNTFGNELAKTDEQYPNKDSRFSGKEPILLNQENPDNKEKVDYEPETDAYLSKPVNAGFNSDVYMPDDEPDLEIMSGAVPTSLATSDKFQPMANFDGTSAIDMAADLAPAPISIAWHRLVVCESSDEDDNTSDSSIPEELEEWHH